ncbi:D-alanine--D-alanine ligase [candidate division KSB1 bacterium]|nr:D-alanine--D-alanine ligase [candidate division KSB1 bacterium]
MNQKLKRRVAVIFGGRSTEHEVSLTSALAILKEINREHNEVYPVRISPDGHWALLDNRASYNSVQALTDSPGKPIVTGDPSIHGFLLLNKNSGGDSVLPVDAVFPVLHGSYGEDGTIQGLFRMADLPCVGAGVLGSAIGMDKIMMKQIFIQNDLQTADFIWFLRSAWQKESEVIQRGVTGSIGYPCFVKPANAGSSVGISKVLSEAELPKAVETASQFDRKILIEKAVDALELECSVLGNDKPEASVVGEIIPSNEFYDYDAKYHSEASRAVIPAKIPDDLANRLRYQAVAAFKALDCAGMGRVDFLVEKGTHQIYINEINTIPGFTPISMYPKLWEASGLSYPNLIDRLIDLAIERHEDLNRSNTKRS